MKNRPPSAIIWMFAFAAPALEAASGAVWWPYWLLSSLCWFVIDRWALPSAKARKD